MPSFRCISVLSAVHTNGHKVKFGVCGRGQSFVENCRHSSTDQASAATKWANCAAILALTAVTRLSLCVKSPAPAASNLSIRLPSNLKPTTTRKCVHLVTRGHFRSRDKDGDHTIRSAIIKNPMPHANVTALYVLQKRSYGRSKFYIAGMLVSPWPWSDDLHIRTWPEFLRDIRDLQKWTSCTSWLSKVIVRQTERPRYYYRRHRNYIPLRFGGSQ